MFVTKYLCELITVEVYFCECKIHFETNGELEDLFQKCDRLLTVRFLSSLLGVGGYGELRE